MSAGADSAKPAGAKQIEAAAVKQLADELRVRNRHVDHEIRMLKQSIAANTALTEVVKSDVKKLRDETQPVVDAIQTMEAGIRIIGSIGTAGIKVGKGLLVIAAGWAAVKLLANGGSWSEMQALFMRSIGK